MRDKRILIIISQRNFCDEEYRKTREIFESFGIICKVAATELLPAVGMQGIYINPDFLLGKIKPNEYDALCFIGGVGCTVYWHDKDVHNLVIEANNEELLIGAICLAPVILANAGLLKNKRATVYPSAENYIKKKGVLYTGKRIETDKNIVTAMDPKAAEIFALEMCNLLVKTAV